MCSLLHVSATCVRVAVPCVCISVRVPRQIPRSRLASCASCHVFSHAAQTCDKGLTTITRAHISRDTSPASLRVRVVRPLSTRHGSDHSHARPHRHREAVKEGWRGGAGVRCSCVSNRRNVCQKRPITVSKETYYCHKDSWVSNRRNVWALPPRSMMSVCLLPPFRISSIVSASCRRPI